MQCFLGQQHDSKLKVRVKYNIDVFVKSYVRKRKLYYKKQWLTYALLNNKAFKPNKANEKHDCIRILFSHSKFFCSLPPYSYFSFLLCFTSCPIMFLFWKSTSVELKKLFDKWHNLRSVIENVQTFSSWRESRPINTTDRRATSFAIVFILHFLV